MRAEHGENWLGAYGEMNESYLPNGANVVSSHAIFKIKIMDDGSLKMKGSIVVHVNRDSEKDYKRGKCSATNMLVVKLVIAIGIGLDFTFRTGNIKGAFMHSGPIHHEV